MTDLCFSASATVTCSAFRTVSPVSGSFTASLMRLLNMFEPSAAICATAVHTGSSWRTFRILSDVDGAFAIPVFDHDPADKDCVTQERVIGPMSIPLTIVRRCSQPCVRVPSTPVLVQETNVVHLLRLTKCTDRAQETRVEDTCLRLSGLPKYPYYYY